ncbi:patched domain-containing protein 3 [Phymastichus coffea]|uniref:patched domain-containing protein 3 n=1 Tax=Phymastichus coffea TaxID=108790 RepID=UPI00273C4996|nr:patched domain-containing protein 3 [Phymastichus coffea]
MLSITCVDDFLNKAFFKIGLTVGRHPGYFVIVPVLLGCICLTGYQRITYEIDPEYLFSPINGPGKAERAVVEEHFQVNYSDKFSIARITRPGRFGHVVVLSKDNDTNLLRSVIFEELIVLDQMIRNATAVYDGETYNYAKICAKWLGECFTNDILELDQIIEDVENKEMNLTFPISFNPVTWTPHLIPVYFGGSVVNEDLVLEAAPALQMGYFVVVDNAKQDAIGAAWEEAFLDAVGKAEDEHLFKHISVARFASRTLELEFERNTQTVIPYYFSTFTIMALFSIVTCMMSDWVRSKPWLGLLGNVSAGMATTAAFGLCCYLGVEFIGINLAAPFLMIGIGIDDTFVMLAAWRRTNIMDPVPLRMAHALSEAAVSITITSVTDMVSFFIGIISPFPSVKIFCIYSGFSVVFTFVFHLTFFAGCMAISGYCEQKNLHSVICCSVQPLSKSEHRSWFYRVFCTGGLDPEDPNNPVDNPEHGCMSWFRDYLAAALNQPIVKVVVILIFGLYLAGGLYGLTTLKEGLDRRRLSKSDSYSITFYDREDTYYREFPYRIQVVVSGQYNYSDPVIQEQMENLTLSLEGTKWIGSNIYTESWLRSFLSFYEDHREEEDHVNYTILNEKGFINTLRNTFLYPTSTWALDVKFDDNTEHIVASRFLIQAVNVSGTNNEKDMVRELRQICEDSPLNATVFHPYFVFFDQFELVMPTSIQCLTYGALTMMVISFIFIPNVLCSLWVAFCIISIEIGVAGYMALWDVSLDSISMINLIMCIGFSVDFTAHICYAYMSSKQKRPEDRVKECLYTLGLPIVQGSLSTIIGLFALVLADTYIFLVFFKMVFLVVFLGALHGLFLLPVLLSVFGPGSWTDFDQQEELEKAEDIAKLPKPYVIPHPTLLYSKGKDVSPVISTTALEDRDLGLGTSEDSNSTESGSSQSRRKDRQTEHNEQNKSHYQDWRRSLGVLHSLSQFQTSAPLPDYPGGHAADERHDRNHRNITFLHNTTRLPPTSTNNNKQDCRRSRSQQNLNQSPSRY